MVAPAALLDYIAKATVPLSLADPKIEDSPLVTVNQAFCNMSGYDADEVVGQNCRFLQGDLRDQPGVAEVRDFLDQKTASRMVRTKIINRRKDGTWFVNLLTVSRICDSNEQTCLLFGSQFDVGMAQEGELRDYIDQLSGHVERTRQILSPHHLQMSGSVAALADAATAIAHAKLLIGSMDNSLS